MKKNIKRLSKKGSITDLGYIMSGIFAVAVVAFLVTVLANRINTEVQDLDLFNANAKSASTKISRDFPVVMNGGVIVIFFGMMLVSLVLASLVPVHPAFIAFYIIEVGLYIWIGAGIANAYQRIVELSIFTTEYAQFNIAIFFFRWFPYFIAISGIALAMFMYKVKSDRIIGSL